MGLAAGSAVVVLSLASVVPDRIGSVLAPPTRRFEPPRTFEAPAADENNEPETAASTASPPPPRPTTPTNVAPVERRRGFSPVIRPDEPPPAAEPPRSESVEVAAAEPDPVNADASPQALGHRAATRAAMRASALAGRFARVRAGLANSDGNPPAEGFEQNVQPSAEGNGAPPSEAPAQEPAVGEAATSEPAASE